MDKASRDQSPTTCRGDECALATENARLRQALADVMDPLAYFRRRAEAQGARLSSAAYALSNDLGCITSIAREALARPEPPAPTVSADPGGSHE